MPDRSFWRRRKVFLTGHTGFKGSWLTLWLDALGADVTGYSLDPPTDPDLFNQANLAGCLRSIRGDVRDFHQLKSAMAECRPDVILHLAAQSVVLQRLRRSHRDLLHQCHGDGSRFRGAAAIETALRRSQCDQ